MAPQAGLLDLIENAEQLRSVLESRRIGITCVKPKVFFEEIEREYATPVALNLHTPPSGIGSITLLEGAILASLVRIMNPVMIFEFGTYLGYSTALLLRNSSDQCIVYSIDLGDAGIAFSQSRNYSKKELYTDDKKNDDYLRYIQSMKGHYYLSGLTMDDQSRLRLLFGDSTKLDIVDKKLTGIFDYIFIDGGHDYETIKSDTQKALQMIGQDGAIIWHDFNSTIHSDVTKFINDLAHERQILHVQNTMLAILLQGEARANFANFGL